MRFEVVRNEKKDLYLLQVFLPMPLGAARLVSSKRIEKARWWTVSCPNPAPTKSVNVVLIVELEVACASASIYCEKNYQLNSEETQSMVFYRRYVVFVKLL